MDDRKLKKLSYSIHKYSSYSAEYIPQNILENKPTDQSSRWSSDTNEFPQYLLLKLDQPAIVKYINFGKFEKSHACNIKKFSISGGLTEDNMITLLESSLKNNNIPESFNLLHTVGTNYFPLRFIKIMPLQCWTHSFNFSIWHVFLKGFDDWNFVQKCINKYAVYREKEAIRLCLKHFRQHNYTDAFQTLSITSDVQLEHPTLTELHDCLVKIGNFESGEELMKRAATDGLLEEYVGQLNYKPKWNPFIHTNKPRPGMRGGHQMCINTNNQTIYLFGGWDGSQDLSDLWSYSIVTDEWKCITENTQSKGGPSGRSCHKMCLDPNRNQLFTLGKYLDSNLRQQQDNLKNDFYMYDIESDIWIRISEDTSIDGGPKLVFDHQMVMDVDERVIYVFGGRILAPSRWERIASGLDESSSSRQQSSNSNGSSSSHEPQFSGLFCYHVATSTWTKLREDSSCNTSTHIKSRVGHSMLFHPGMRQLFILAGQRHKEFLFDFFTYDIERDTITSLSDGNQKDASAVPSAGFTQKATIDPVTNEIHVLAGLSKDKDKRDDNVRNSFWVYSIAHNKWCCIYHNDQLEETNFNKTQHAEPCPRYAHQLVYDDINKTHYLFGGNPGKQSLPKLRLDDFWSLHLCRPTADQLLTNCLFMIRKTHFQELAHEDPMKALTYLQNTLHGAVDHQNAPQVKEFQSLASSLFKSPDPTSLFISTPRLHINENFLSDDPEIEPTPGSSQDFTDSPLSLESPVSSMDEENSQGDSNKFSALHNLTKEQLMSWQHLARSQLFDELTKFFPDSMVQPRSSLVDLIPF